MSLYKVEEGRLKYYFHQGQYKAWNSSARVVGVLAGTQGGKTSFGPPWLYREMQRRGPGDYLVVAPTYPLLSKKLLPEFRRFFERYLDLGTYRGSPDRVFTISEEGQKKLWGSSGPDYETFVFFGHAQDPDSLESATAKAAWLDEAGQKKFRLASYEALRRRLSIHQGRVLITTTPYNLGWLKQQIWDKRFTDEIDIIRFESIMNPVFPRAEYDWAEENLPGWKFNLFYRAIFTRPAGIIYDCFDDETQKVPRFNVPAHWPRFWGLDFGPVNTVCNYYAHRPNSEDYVLYRIYKAGGRTAQEHYNAMIKGEPGPPKVVVGGSMSEGNWRTEFRAAGLPVREPDQPEVEVGINRVYGMHKQKRIFVQSHLDSYFEEIATYSRELDENDEPTEKIENKNSFHILDAERSIMGWINRKGKQFKTKRHDWRAAQTAESEEFVPYRSEAEAEEVLKEYERINT